LSLISTEFYRDCLYRLPEKEHSIVGSFSVHGTQCSLLNSSSNCSTGEDDSINNFLTADGSLKMGIKFIQYGKKSECNPVDGNDDTLRQASGAKLLKDFGALLGSKSLSDLKIETKDGRIFDAHKLILSGKHFRGIVF
jgi:hypothetical protein